MNDSRQEQPASDDQTLLDCLVDGELSEPDRRALLMRLDQQSDGWRRCALAFLEAQSWDSEFGAMAKNATKPQPEEIVVQPVAAATRSWLAGPWGTALAMAASFLMALGLGIAWQNYQSGLATTGNQVVQSRRDAAEDPVPSGRASPESTPLKPGSPSGDIGSVLVSLDRDQDGTAEPVEVPVVSGRGLDEAWLRDRPPALPPEVLQMLQRAGHRVEQNRQLYPFQLEDGRKVVVPVDQIDVHYVGDRAFQ